MPAPLLAAPAFSFLRQTFSLITALPKIHQPDAPAKDAAASFAGTSGWCDLLTAGEI